MSEYNNFNTGASCSYANLGNYNGGYSMNITPQGKVTSGAYIVPTWSPISYDSLVGEVPTCSGYADINHAYAGAGGGKCQTTYRTSLCGSAIGADCGSLPPSARAACCRQNPGSNGCNNLKN